MTDLAALEVLVGKWTAEAVDPRSGEPIRGTMTVEWLEGGGYLVQRTTLENPVFPRTLSMFGPDRAGRIVQHYFDSRGVARIYDVSLEDGVLTLSRDDEDMAQRYTGRLSGDGSAIEGAWERTGEDRAWMHDFALTFRRR